MYVFVCLRRLHLLFCVFLEVTVGSWWSVIAYFVVYVCVFAALLLKYDCCMCVCLLESWKCCIQWWDKRCIDNVASLRVDDLNWQISLWLMPAMLAQQLMWRAVMPHGLRLRMMLVCAGNCLIIELRPVGIALGLLPGPGKHCPNCNQSTKSDKVWWKYS